MNTFIFPVYEPGVPCHTVGLHYGCHPDEAAGIVFNKYYGDIKHPGITEAIENESFLFVDAGITSYQGKSWRQWHREGVIFIGTMGSPYDEHVLPDHIREQECAATLVARALELKSFEIKKILKGLLLNDRGTENNITSFSSHLRNGHLMHVKEGIAGQLKMLKFAMQPFEWALMLQNRFVNEVSKECKRNARIQMVKYMGNMIKIAIIQSDDPQMASVAKTSYGVHAHVVICKNSKGHVYICTSSEPFVDLTPVAKAIKIEEFTLKGMSFNPNDPRLEAEGVMVGLEEWHFQKEANCGRLFNGSLNAPHKPRTRIPFGALCGIVYRTLKGVQRQEAILRNIA